MQLPDTTIKTVYLAYLTYSSQLRGSTLPSLPVSVVLHCIALRCTMRAALSPAQNQKSKPYVRTYTPVHSADIPYFTSLPRLTYLRSSAMRCDSFQVFPCAALRCAAFPAFPSMSSNELENECVTEGVYSPLHNPLRQFFRVGFAPRAIEVCDFATEVQERRVVPGVPVPVPVPWSCSRPWLFG